MKKRSIFIVLGIFLLFVLFVLLGQLTNPYSAITLINSPFHTSVDNNGEIILQQTAPVHFTNNFFAKKFASINQSSRFVFSTLFREQPFSGNEEEIIAKIHTQSFNSTKPYVISGTHFSDIYVRNLGVQYNAVLDNRIATDKTDWLNRQEAMLQGVALNLELLKQSGKEYTTFMPLPNNYYAATNVYTDPSDSLFGVLYALTALRDENFIHKLFPADIKQSYPLQTKQAADMLLQKYKPFLQKAVTDYQNQIVDPKTGLIRKDITLASARDGIKRQSSFYDNVILWGTVNIAQNLGILEKKQDMQAWKEKIINTFWDEKDGLFLDDLSTASQNEKRFSGDSFIVTGSSFFDLKNSQDRTKLRRMIVYVEKNKFDQPFPLKYAEKDHPENLYWPVKTFAPSYMGETIWSNWGIEYIKALILLSPEDKTLLQTANKHLMSYKNNIERTGGYPELYDTSGNMYNTLLYHSILHTSWVVDYEEAKMLLQTAQGKSPTP